MRNFLLIPCIAVLFLSSCNSADNKTSANSSVKTDNSATADSNTKAILIDPALPPVKLPADDSVLAVSFAEKNEQAVHGRLGLKGPDIICKFSIPKSKKLTARLIPVKKDCNIRFTQIIMPGNNADGPFGLEIKYNLPAKGDYQLIIGHNMMAGDPESCEFEIKIKVE